MRILRTGVTLVAGAMLSACAARTTVSPSASIGPRKAAKITFLYQSNRFGVLEPCGCQSHPWGGIDREANAIGEIRKGASPTLYVDSGNALAPTGTSSHLEHRREKARAIVAILDEMALDVLAPGPSDYALGADTLKSLAAKSRFRWVSTNVARDGKPVFERYVILERAGTRYAFLSATPEGALTEPGLSVEAPEGAIAKALAELAGKADFVVLLSQLGAKQDEVLAKRTPGVQLVVGADTAKSFDMPLWIAGHTLIVDPQNEGHYIGRLDLSLELPFQGFYSDSVIEQNRTQLAQWKAALEKNPSDKLARMYIDFLTANACLDRIAGGSTYTHELVKLDPKRYGAKNAITKLLAKEKERVRKQAIDSAE